MKTYPLLVQYNVENLTDKSRNFKAEFATDKFFVDYLDVIYEALRANRTIRSIKRKWRV